MMPKIRVGNKQNSFLNGEWAGHVHKGIKKITSGKRRMEDKRVIKAEESDFFAIETQPFIPHEIYKK